MKLLMFFAKEFWYTPYKKTLEEVPEAAGEVCVKDAVVAYYHVEEHDVERASSVQSKLVKNLKWLTRKFGVKSVVLHSFTHLSTSKAPPEFARELIGQARERLERVGYEVLETPYGYLLEWRLHVPGESLGRVFKDL